MSLTGIGAGLPSAYGLYGSPIASTSPDNLSASLPGSPALNPMADFTTATGGLPSGGSDMMGLLMEIMSLMTSMLSIFLGGGGLSGQPSFLANQDNSGGISGNTGTSGTGGTAGDAGNAGNACNDGNANGPKSYNHAPSPSSKDANTPASGSPSPGTGGGITPNSALGGANTIPSRLKSASEASGLVDKVKQSGGGTVRIQMSHDEINNAGDMEKLKAMVEEGDKQGVKIQFTFRDNDNGGGGNTLTGDKLTQAEQDETNVIKKLGNHQSFVLDTINESGQHTNDAWFKEQSALVKNALNSGLAGNKIMVEDSEWGGGMSNGSGDSGLATYGKQLLAIDPELQASFHVYNKADSGDKVASDVKKEVEALKAAGFNQKGQINIGEEGNANWKGSGDNFEELKGVTSGLNSIKDYLTQNGIVVLPWMDQFVNGKLQHTVGQGADGQIL